MNAIAQKAFDNYVAKEFPRGEDTMLDVPPIDHFLEGWEAAQEHYRKSVEEYRRKVIRVLTVQDIEKEILFKDIARDGLFGRSSLSNPLFSVQEWLVERVKNIPTEPEAGK